MALAAGCPVSKMLNRRSGLAHRKIVFVYAWSSCPTLSGWLKR
jgi:hypothetical protein